ncbi:MAG: Glyoxalase/Bleomycin resistance protein/Dihydroxybiphenyl dioxygenase [Benniella sp.]|nr:MAG: Glyoxalase/Bleomycin resistance protein/Dihydroxybiphenyl dioxygenase [Benniella sp.]
MTKRASVSGPEIAHDVDMSAADQSTKKVKLDHDTFAYPQDEYVIRSDFLKNSRFEVLYMAVRARAELPRLLLEYVGATYTSAAPVDWPASKKETPFGLLPVLTHFKPDGSTFTLPEASALTRYLARLFDLVGETLEEDSIVDACYQCAMDNVLNCLMQEIWLKSDPKSKENIDAAFEKLVPFFDGLEQYLVKNGSNGYIVGEKTTYAEFAWYDWIEHFYSEYPEQMAAITSETVRPGVYKMYKRFETNPRIRAYIAGGRWEHRPASPLINFYSAGVIVSDWERAFEFYSKTLGLVCKMNVQPEHTAEGGRYIEFVVNEQEKTRFTVYCAGKNPKHEIPPHQGGVNFTVRSVQETYNRLVKKGVEFKMIPTVMPWGSMAQFVDPEGNTLTINSPPM